MAATKAIARLFNTRGTTIASCPDTKVAITKCFAAHPTAAGVHRATPAAPRDQIRLREEFVSSPVVSTRAKTSGHLSTRRKSQ